jgi:hypothetical protein
LYILFTDHIHQTGCTPALFGDVVLFRYLNRLSCLVCPLIQQEQYVGAGYLPRRMDAFGHDVVKPLLFFLS